MQVNGSVTFPSSKSIQLDGNPVAGSSKLINLSGDNTIDGPIALEADETVNVAAGLPARPGRRLERRQVSASLRRIPAR